MDLIPDDQWRHCEHLARLMTFALSRFDANDLEGFRRLVARVVEEAEKEKADETIPAR